MTLEAILEKLVEHYGWPKLGEKIRINCFNSDPSIKSSLKFLRKTPWARAKVERLYLGLPAILVMIMMILALAPSAHAQTQIKFKRIPLQYIVALGDPSANSGSDAQSWGLWRQDPGPRGCRLENYEQLNATGVAPAQWSYDKKDWWLEEHGLIMEKPTFPLPPGKYVVTGGRAVTSVLTVDLMDKSGSQHWQLDRGATLDEVTHLPCHAARYTPAEGNADCSPDRVEKSVFPVAPGISMPSINGCIKKDYAVLFVIGIAEQPTTP